ncbi:MAG: hypothetical protein OIF40_09545, partial [Mangrovicoccus sp.]|nr:hypothetical protein [Mangrovicoccus sp.]
MNVAVSPQSLSPSVEIPPKSPVFGPGFFGSFGPLPTPLAQHLWPETRDFDPFGPGRISGAQWQFAGLTLAGHVRLDNRAEIAAALGADGAQALALGGMGADAALIALAYRHWGIDGFARLAGDFALALWDGAAENLLLLRDHMGVRPLYYSAGHDHLAFAAEQPRLQYEPPGLGQADIAG